MRFFDTHNFSYGKSETTTTYVYDSTGARVKKVAGGTTTVYLGKDYDITGGTTTKYIFLGDRRVAQKDSSNVKLYFHEDHINSSNVITDSSGDQVALYEYDPYGATATHTGASDVKHQFTGQEKDDSTGLHYYGARYYDSQLGRFITADPTIQHPKDPQDFNRYAYARNNPIKFNDPTGLGWFSKLIGAIVGVVVGLYTFSVTGDPKLAFSAGVGAYRATDALISTGNLRKAAVAGINGFGEGQRMFDNPGQALGLLTDNPTTDHLTKDGRKALKQLLNAFGIPPGLDSKIANQIASALTNNSQSNAYAGGAPSNFFEALKSILSPNFNDSGDFGGNFWSGVYNDISTKLGGGATVGLAHVALSCAYAGGGGGCSVNGVKSLFVAQFDVSSDITAKGHEVGLNGDIIGVPIGYGTKFSRGAWQKDFNVHAGFSWPPTLIDASFDRNEIFNGSKK